MNRFKVGDLVRSNNAVVETTVYRVVKTRSTNFVDVELESGEFRYDKQPVGLFALWKRKINVEATQ